MSQNLPEDIESEAVEPLVNEKDWDIKAPMAERHASPSGNKAQSILVVDDEPAIRSTLRTILKKAGYLVDTAEDFKSAVELIEQNGYAVVIVDIILPDASGIDVLKHVREFNQENQLITITGDPNIDTAAEAVRAGAYDYITKPIRRDVFLTVVEKAAEKARLLREKKELEELNILYQKHLEKLIEQRTEQLKASELKYRNLFEYANDSIFLLDSPSGKIVDVNQQAMLLTNLKKDRLLRRYLWFMEPHSKTCQLKEFFKSVVKKGDGRLDDVHLKTGKDKMIRADLSAKVIELGTQRQVQVMIRDVTEEKMLEDKQREMELDLIREQKLASIGMMASGIAHNINTPLMGIIGLSQFMMMKAGETEELKSIIEQANRISTIVKNLMFKSRSEQEKDAVFIDISRLLEEELRFLQADLDFKHNVEKDYHFQDGLPHIHAVYSDFSQSLTNIIRNALDAMYQSPEKRLTVQTRLVGDWIAVDIIDSGCGIPKDQIPRLFSPFFTTKPVTGKEKKGEPTGTGLGLSTVYKLLSNYGVRYDIKSQVGKGTRFTVRIPCHKSNEKKSR
jgi:two-component system sporulation sensor kinase A